MEAVRTVKLGDNLVITGSDKAAVEAAASALAAKGAKILSKVEPLGSKWMVTCEDPNERGKECKVVKLGLQLVVKGSTEAMVRQKVQELMSGGAKLVSPPSEATGGGWVAICDDVGQVQKW